MSTVRAAAATRLHVERTADPAVLRWVVHDTALADAGDGPRTAGGESSLARVVAGGAIAELSVRRGHVLVRAADSDLWPTLVPGVHAAIAADLASRASWVTERTVPAVAVSVRRRD